MLTPAHARHRRERHVSRPIATHPGDNRVARFLVFAASPALWARHLLTTMTVSGNLVRTAGHRPPRPHARPHFGDRHHRPVALRSLRRRPGDLLPISPQLRGHPVSIHAFETSPERESERSRRFVRGSRRARASNQWNSRPSEERGARPQRYSRIQCGWLNRALVVECDRERALHPALAVAVRTRAVPRWRYVDRSHRCAYARSEIARHPGNNESHDESQPRNPIHLPPLPRSACCCLGKTTHAASPAIQSQAVEKHVTVVGRRVQPSSASGCGSTLTP